MGIEFNKNWWKDIFDDIYLLTDARSVCNEDLTIREVDFLEKTLDLDKTSPILDLCGGQGRHALELSRRGFAKVTTLDYSKYLIHLGQQRARQENLNTFFIRGDARRLGLYNQIFRVIIIMGSSFGYFVQDDENQKILSEAFRLLEPKGQLILDVPNPDYVLRKFKPYTRHQVGDDIEVSRTRKLGHDIIYCREKVSSVSKGIIREKTYCTQLYSPEKITSLLGHAGFSNITCNRDFIRRESEGDYGTMTNRMIVIAERIE
jgi:D-alanine-D-alanine ligase